MKTRWGRQVHDPKTWIEISCSGLCPDARRIIDREIMDHYREALADAVTKGIPPIQAIKLALQCLGDPVVAARGFRRVHLTDSELRWLSPRVNPILMALGTLLVLGIWLLWWEYEAVWMAAIFPLYATYLLTSILMHGRRPWTLVATFYFLFLTAIISISPDPMFACVWILLVAGDLLMSVHMQGKLRRVAMRHES